MNSFNLFIRSRNRFETRHYHLTGIGQVFQSGKMAADYRFSSASVVSRPPPPSRLFCPTTARSAGNCSSAGWQSAGRHCRPLLLLGGCVALFFPSEKKCFSDLASMFASPDGHRYILVICDIFNELIKAEAIGKVRANFSWQKIILLFHSVKRC